MREMAILNGIEEAVPAAAPVPVATPVLRATRPPRGVPHPHAVHHGRGSPVPRIPAIQRPRGPPVGHVTVTAARSAAGLGPSSPTVAHAAPRGGAVPGESYGVCLHFSFCLSLSKTNILGRRRSYVNNDLTVPKKKHFKNDCLIRLNFMGFAKFFNEMEDGKRKILQRKSPVKYLELWIK